MAFRTLVEKQRRYKITKTVTYYATCGHTRFAPSTIDRAIRDKGICPLCVATRNLKAR